MLGQEALSAARAQGVVKREGGGDFDLCVICAEDFMTLSGGQFRSVVRYRCKG